MLLHTVGNFEQLKATKWTEFKRGMLRDFALRVNSKAQEDKNVCNRRTEPQVYKYDLYWCAQFVDDFLNTPYNKQTW